VSLQGFTRPMGARNRQRISGTDRTQPQATGRDHRTAGASPTEFMTASPPDTELQNTQAIARTPQQARRSLEDAQKVARVCDDYRGRDTIVLDLTGITPICDYFVITTGTNRRQIHAIANEVNRVLKEGGSRRMGRE